MESVKYIDVHAHLDDEHFDPDRDEVLRRASDVLVFNAGVNHESNMRSLALASTYRNIKACLGVHPDRAFRTPLEEVSREAEFIRRNTKDIVAISEVGLDYKFSERERQKDAFRIMLRLAEELDKPVIVHSRRAAGSILKVLKDFHVRVNLHAFSGTIEEAAMGLREGYYFSFGPNLAFNEYKRRLAEVVPMERMLTETDSPVLGPNPSERNEPKNVRIAAQKIAEIKGQSVEEVERTVVKNGKQLFKV